MYATILIAVFGLQVRTPSQSLPKSVDLAARNRAESQLAREQSVRLELTKAMEFRKVKQGDRIVAELMENLEFDGRVIVARGAKVQGRILEVRRERGIELDVVHPIQLLDEAYLAGELYTLPTHDMVEEQKRQRNRAIVIGIGILIGFILARRRKRS